MSEKIQMEGIRNLRSLGGLPVGSGHVRQGLLLRSARLSDASSGDLLNLRENLGLRCIIDFRNDQEIYAHPDPALPGATYWHVPMFAYGGQGIVREEATADPIQVGITRGEQLRGGGAKLLLTRMYPRMASDPENRKQLRDFFHAILRCQEGAVLWHCTSGKDRTGVASALLLTALGADWDTVMDDYLLTNRQQAPYRAQIRDALEKRGASQEAIQEIMTLESVDSLYLNSFRQTAQDQFGSLECFLRQGLGLSEKDLNQLRDRFTE